MADPAAEYFKDVEITGILNIILGYIQMNNQEIKGLKSEGLTQSEINALTPLAAYAQRSVFNTTTKKWGYCDGTAWIYPSNDALTLSGKDLTYILSLANATGTLPLGSLPAHASTHRMNGSDELLLNQLGLPSSSVLLNSQKIVSMANGTADTDAATLGQVKALMSGSSWKDRVKVISTSNITLSGLQTIDGYTLLAGDRVAVSAQTTSANNGIYVAGSGVWSRSLDADSWDELVSATFYVEKGTIYKDTQWNCNIDTGGTLGTTAITLTNIPIGGDVTAGNGIVKVGNQVSVNYDDVTLGFINGKLVIKTGYIPKVVKMPVQSATAGASQTITHNMTTIPTSVQFRRIATGSPVFPSITSITSTTIVFSFSSAVANATTFEVCLMGVI